MDTNKGLWEFVNDTDPEETMISENSRLWLSAMFDADGKSGRIFAVSSQSRVSYRWRRLNLANLAYRLAGKTLLAQSRIERAKK